MSVIASPISLSLFVTASSSSSYWFWELDAASELLSMSYSSPRFFSRDDAPSSAVVTEVWPDEPSGFAWFC
ncbi:hypothetical protein ACOSP7_026562 [Xanthoceras sorbifolium]